MAYNYYNSEFTKYFGKVLPHTVHLHVIDANGVDGEGIQIRKRDVYFKVLKRHQHKFAPDVQFIPEVRLGHKNHAEAFWAALSFLEKEGF